MQLKFYFNNSAINVFKCFILLLIISLNAHSQDSIYPYKLSEKDYFLLPGSILTKFSGDFAENKLIFNLTINEIEKLNANSISRFDRSATNNWDRDLNKISDIISQSLLILPAALSIPDLYNRNLYNIATVGIMYIETYFFIRGITKFTKAFSGRIRPYLYNNSFTPEERFLFQDNEAPVASTSFFSGHTSAAFASSVFLSKVYSDIYGKTTMSYIIWGSTSALAAYTGYCRIRSGEHFPTDVIAAALVGSAVGYVIPVLHKNKSEKFILTFSPEVVNFVYTF